MQDCYGIVVLPREQLKKIHVDREKDNMIQRNYGRIVQYLKLRGSLSKRKENAKCVIRVTTTVQQL